MSDLSRRGFLRGTALLLVGLLAQGSAASALARLAPRARLARPLRMLAIGDSVVWGQGLKVENKFTDMVRDWLCKQRNGGSCENKEDVQLHVEAHSGAIISKENDRDDEKEDVRFTRGIAPLKYEGEVNNGYPTILAQVELAKSYYKSNSIPPEEVDLVILDGGINDLNAAKLLLPKWHDGDVRKKADEFCGERMRALLFKTAAAFPNARIVVIGYFPLVSTVTPPGIIWDTIKEWFHDRRKENLDDGTKVEEALDERSIERESRHESGLHPVLNRLAARSREWVRASDEALNGAVKDLNDHTEKALVVNDAAGAPPEAFQRALFVHVPFKEENAYGTETTFLWKLGRKASDAPVECFNENFAGRLLVNDEMQIERPCMCDQAERTGKLTCVRAGAFHPNTKGAKAYFNAITEKLGPILRHTGWV